MSLLFKNTAIYGLGNIAQKAFNFFIVFLYTQYISPAEIGVINTLQIFSAIYVLFLSFGLERSLYRLYHDYKNDEDKAIFLGTINIGILLVSIFIICITFLFHNQITFLFEDISFYPLIILGITDAFLTAITIVPKLLFQISGKPLKFIMLTIGQVIANVICIGYALYLGYRSAESIFLAGIIASLCFMPINIFIMWTKMKFTFNLFIFFNTLKYTLPLVPSLISAWVINASDRLFIKHFYNMTEVGLYSVAYKIGQVVQLFATALLMAYNPIFFSLANSEDADKKKLLSLHNSNIWILAFLCFFIALISKDFMFLVLKKEYLQVAYIVPMIVSGYFFIQMNGLQNLSFYQSKKTFPMMIISIISAFINILLNYFLIKKMGMMGAAIATIATQFVFFVITYKISIRYYILRIDFIKMGGIFVLFIGSYFLSNYILHPGLQSLFFKILFCLLISYLFYYKKIKALINNYNNK